MSLERFQSHVPDSTLGYHSTGVVKIRTEEDLSRLGSLYLIHPWINFLLEQQPVGSVAETIPEGNMDDQSSLGLFLDSPGSIASPSLHGWLSALFGQPFGGRTTPSPRGVASLLPPSSLSQTDKQIRALRVIARLRQPFGALLLTPHLGNVADDIGGSLRRV